MKEYLFYVRKYDIFVRDYRLCIYRCETSDPLHTVGEIYYRTFEDIKRIDFVKCSEEKLEYWKNEGVEVYWWHNKYALDYNFV